MESFRIGNTGDTTICGMLWTLRTLRSAILKRWLMMCMEWMRICWFLSGLRLDRWPNLIENWIRKVCCLTSPHGPNQDSILGRPIWNILPEYAYTMPIIRKPVISIGNIWMKVSSSWVWTAGGWILRNLTISIGSRRILIRRPIWGRSARCVMLIRCWRWVGFMIISVP